MNVATIPLQSIFSSETLTYGDAVRIDNIPFDIDINQNINSVLANELDRENFLVNHLPLIETIGQDLYDKLSKEKINFLIETSGFIKGEKILTTKIVKDYLDDYL